MSEYVLGSSDPELARLRFQQQVWSGVSERFLDRLHLHEGARVLDAGCGPGLMLESLRARVGTSGRVVALDSSPHWMACVARLCSEHGWRNVHLQQGELQSAPLEPKSFDLIWMRWVLSFLPDAQGIVNRLAGALRPHGILAIQDYNHEGVSLFPESAGFRAIVRATRALYAKRGGDVWIAGSLPRIARFAGLQMLELHPNVLCGTPSSDAFRWADAFFPHYSLAMEEAGLLSAGERRAFLDEWDARRRDPDAFFCSPIVIGMIARRAA